MSAVTTGKSIVKRCIVLVAGLMLIGVQAGAQKKPAQQAPKAPPAQHQAQAPANRGPAGNAQHTSGPGGGANRATGPGPAGQHPGGPQGQAGRPGTAGAANKTNAPQTGRPGAANQANKGGMANQGNRGGAGVQGNKGAAAAQGNKAGPGGRAGQGNLANKGGAGGKAAQVHQPVRNTRQVGNLKVSADKKGHVRDIRGNNGLNVHRSLNGNRRVEKTFPGGRKVVADGRGRGYMQRPYVNRNGREYVQRTYVVNNVAYTRVYSTYYYGGRPYYGYAPAYYYQPVYYGWAYNPWPAPVYYNWGWNASPWYGPYGYYYSPAPYYPSSSLWLTDYMMSENLRLAYEAGVAAGARGGGSASKSNPYHVQQNAYASVGFLPALPAGKDTAGQFPADLRNQLAEQVKALIADEKAASEKSGSASAQGSKNSDQTPPALDPKFTLFIVSSEIDVTNEDDEECSLSGGDVIKRMEDAPGDDEAVQVEVKSSKKDDCKVGSKPRVQVSDLQEMYNQFREQIDAGLKSLAEKQGKEGIPKAPDTSTKDGEVPAPPPDSNAKNEVQKQVSEADQAEKEAGGGNQ